MIPQVSGSVSVRLRKHLFHFPSFWNERTNRIFKFLEFCAHRQLLVPAGSFPTALGEPPLKLVKASHPLCLQLSAARLSSPSSFEYGHCWQSFCPGEHWEQRQNKVLQLTWEELGAAPAALYGGGGGKRAARTCCKNRSCLFLWEAA